MDALPTKIDDYAVIGDCRSVALVSRLGSLDWLCWPRFESPPIFAALLDAERGGTWRIAPIGPARTARRYVDGTNVLETTFDTASGRVVLTDLMAIASEADKRRVPMPGHEIVRRVACDRGEVEVAVHADPRPDFGRARLRITNAGRLGLRWQLGSKLLTLRSEIPIALGEDGIARASVLLRAGEAATFSLTFDEDGPAVLPPLGDFTRETIARSIAWWRDWIGHARYDGPYRDAVLRSALAVKLMAFSPSGAIVAAPTTSLPERVGGDLNWDYRFCWLRDAAFTARALLGLGYADEAMAYCDWLLHATRLTRPELRIMYDVYGRTPLEEREVPGLSGHRGSRPVRIGNAARDQLQLDTYGEVIDATTRLLRIDGSIDGETRRLLRDFGHTVCRHWHEPDDGIWEPRERRRHRTHSRLLCWVAVDRLLELHDRGLVDGDREILAAHRAAIRADIEAHAYDPALASYTSELGGGELDASVLLMSWHGFHPPDSARMQATYARLHERLSPRPGLLYRYEDSIKHREGAFWICSFWAVEHLARGGGTLDEARALFDAARAYANDLGLMAEEVDPRTGEMIGNFPQAYTHVGLISAALAIAERERQLVAGAAQPELRRHARPAEVRT